MSTWKRAVWLVTAIALTGVVLRLAQDTTAGQIEAPSSPAGQAASYSENDEEMGGIGNNDANDQRSDVMNPNNAAFQAATDNRSNQMNPNNSAYQSSRGR